ncbi:uncharacterized protein [Neodiprion pinetum]|uniref:uncharacterized protein n=1 Tax=Neodiprion pinetum TaxID=441929 RepID=UPI0037186EA0
MTMNANSLDVEVSEQQQSIVVPLGYCVEIESEVIAQYDSVNRRTNQVEEIQRTRRETNAENQRHRRNNNQNFAAENEPLIVILELQDPAIVSVPRECVTELAAEIIVTQNYRDQEANNRLADAQRHNVYRARRREERNSFLAGQIAGVQEHYEGSMTELCTHCSAAHFISEKVSNTRNSFHDCCSHGKVHLEPLPEMPPELHSLFDGTHEKSNSLFERIRNYNASFSFASFNANLINFEGRRPGPYCFKIQCQIYYQVNTALCPAPDELPTYGQLFIVVSNAATDSLQRCNTVLDRGILGALDRIMSENNVFAQLYQMMGEELRAHQDNQFDSAQPPSELQVLFTLKPGMDRRRFNFQRSNEVAAVFSMTADGEIPESYVTIRNKNTRRLQSVSTIDPNLEPWVYPLFYPFGTRGWHRDLRQTGNNQKRVSREAYIRYRMAIRENGHGNAILLGRRLFQQWVVDNYVKIEKDRIEFIKENQRKIRAETYCGLVNYMNTAAQNANARFGRIIILPSSFSGSPRNMMQHYQDAMGIVRKFGKPDLFITMTCNPNWREIRENLLPGQQPSDRPDLTARVFDMKKKHLLDLIVRENFFGETRAFVSTIESQKPGLIHIHLLVALKHKLSTPEMVDKCISAEIPDPEFNPDLHRIVMGNMIHGPCGAWCELNGKYSKHFPKPFRDETTMDADAYPHYRRRDYGALYERRGGHVVDNR